MCGAMRRVALVLAALLVGAGGWWMLRGGNRDAGPQFVATAVDRGPITATVTATGTVNPVETVQVGTYVSGPIQSLGADFNTPVKKGQLLATIDPRPFQLKVAAAEADLANARATLAKSHADLDLKERNRKRQRDLRAQGIVAQSDLDTAESEARQAEAQITLAEAAVRSAEARLAEARVEPRLHAHRVPRRRRRGVAHVSVGPDGRRELPDARRSSRSPPTSPRWR